MSRHDLNDAQWAVIEPLIPTQKAGAGRKRADDRRTLNGILYVLKTGCAWEDLPHEWLRYHLLATLEPMVSRWYLGADLASAFEPVGRYREISLGTSLLGRELCPGEKRGDGVGKTKVGKGSKVMAVVDGNGLPLGLYVDSAQPHEVTLAETTLNTIRVRQKRGRPKTRPKELVADKVFDSAELRRKLRRRGIMPTIPTFARRKRKHPKRGRPIRAGQGFRQRWKVEHCFAWMDNCRRLVVR